MSLNRVALMGRLTHDPELKTTQSGTAVTSFTLAVDDDFKDKQTGERRAQFLDIVAWRQTAEIVCKYCAKGRMIVVDGRLQTRTWEDKNGSRRKATEIIADSVYFADKGKDSAYTANNAETSAGAFAEVEDDSKLPF